MKNDADMQGQAASAAGDGGQGMATSSPMHWQRRQLLKAGALLAGASLLPRFGFAAGGLAPGEYLDLDATAMAEQVRRGAISPEELLAAALARCDTLNPQVNAVVMRHDDYARRLLAARKRQGLARTGALAGVPFLLRTGKRMPERLAEIVIQFKDVPVPLYQSVGGSWAGNRLIVRLQPEDRLQLQLLAKEPGERQRLRPVMLDLDFFDTWRVPVRDAYERLLTDILRGRLDLFLRDDEIRAQWRFVDALRAGFAAAGSPLAEYRSGQWGPQSANLVAVNAGATWAEFTR